MNLESAGLVDQESAAFRDHLVSVDLADRGSVAFQATAVYLGLVV